MSEIITVGLDLAKNVFLGPWGGRYGPRSVAQEAETNAGVRVLQPVAALRCGYGSKRRRPLLEARDRQIGA